MLLLFAALYHDIAPSCRLISCQDSKILCRRLLDSNRENVQSRQRDFECSVKTVLPSFELFFQTLDYGFDRMSFNE